MSKIIIIQMYQAIKLAEDRLEKRDGNGVPGPSHLCPRRHGQDRNPALKSVHELNSSYKSVACKVCAESMLCIALFSLAMVFTLPASQRQQKRTIWLVRSGGLSDILCAPATRGSTRIQWSLSSQLLVLVARRPLDSITGHGDTFQIWCSPFFFWFRSAFRVSGPGVCCEANT